MAIYVGRTQFPSRLIEEYSVVLRADEHRDPGGAEVEGKQGAVLGMSPAHQGFTFAEFLRMAPG